MPFYNFRQNNSYGHFKTSDHAGITKWVIVEAETAVDANARAEQIGLYFDHNFSVDCPCCGTRWREVEEDDGTDTPRVHSDMTLEETAVTTEYWAKVRAGEVVVHFLDGRFGWPFGPLTPE